MPLPLAVPDLAGRFILITGTGSWFAHVCREPERTLGIVRVALDGASVDLLWGFEGTEGPTSELPSHVLGHRARLRADPAHRVIIHTHPTSLIALSALLPPGDRPFTRALWKMHSECLPVFPDGVGVIPWMVPGTMELGEVTAEKLADRRLVMWPLHGVVGTGRTVDEALGIIEAAEKGAEVYLRVCSAGCIRLSISDTQLLQSAQRFGLTPRPGMIGKS
jgi:rhamnulose-1-phosphate aldolase